MTTYAIADQVPATLATVHAVERKYCCRCASEDGIGCEILCRAFLGKDHPDYPAEWIIGTDGPTCTAFERMDR